MKYRVFLILLEKIDFAGSEVPGFSDSETPVFFTSVQKNTVFLNSEISSFSDFSSEKPGFSDFGGFPEFKNAVFFSDCSSEKPSYSEFRNTEHFGVDYIIFMFGILYSL